MTRLLSEGYKVNRLSNALKKSYGRHIDLVEQWAISENIQPPKHAITNTYCCSGIVSNRTKIA